jgi:hypothetical protein
MKTTVLSIILAAGLAPAAQPVRADNPAAPAAQPVPADNSAVPNAAFSASRYEDLWTKSPFAVATSEAGPESPDYMLVGIANVDGISYACLIDAHNQEHFLISSDKPNRGLTLTSITRNHDDTYAAVQKDGESITLKLQQPPPMAAAPGAPSANTVVMPGGMTPQLPMPGANLSIPGSGRPPTRFRRPLIHLPPPPPQQQQPAPAQPAPVQAPPPSQ